MSMRSMNRVGGLCLRAVALSAALLAGGAQAGLYTSSFGALVPGYTANDDDTFAVALPFAFNFFGATYTTAVVSNNGNIQFGTDTGAFISSPLNTQTDFNGIAAFWSDLESRADPSGAPGAGGAGVYMKVTGSQVVFTWDRLGYYLRDYDERVQFQLVLNDPAALTSGEGSIGFFYGAMSGQADNPGRGAAIGFGDGLSAINEGEVSVASGHSTDVAAYAESIGHIWFNVNDDGEPVEIPGNAVPEPSAPGLVLAALGVMALVRRRVVR
jgi:hypothetical protein